MPPLIGIDPGIDGKMLKAFEELGQGSRIVIVDANYAIPQGAHTLDYHGSSSAEALGGTLALVPVEPDGHKVTNIRHGWVYALGAESPEGVDAVLGELKKAVKDCPQKGVMVESVTPVGNNERLFGDSIAHLGFIAFANNRELRDSTLFVRTRDQRLNACALFVVGHAQSDQR